VNVENRFCACGINKRTEIQGAIVELLVCHQINMMYYIFDIWALKLN